MVKHIIRTKEGGTETKQMTPMVAIRAFCLECVGWSYHEVANCTANLCPLFCYRKGKKPDQAGQKSSKVQRSN